jgi:hypothetical protein
MRRVNAKQVVLPRESTSSVVRLERLQSERKRGHPAICETLFGKLCAQRAQLIV